MPFKNGRHILLTTGAGDSALEFLGDAGHVLPKGAQLVVQMHLLNVSEAPVEGSVTIDMRSATAQNPRPVNMVVFGTAAVELPARATTEVVGTCSAFPEARFTNCRLCKQPRSGSGLWCDRCGRPVDL